MPRSPGTVGWIGALGTIVYDRTKTIRSPLVLVDRVQALLLLQPGVFRAHGGRSRRAVRPPWPPLSRWTRRRRSCGRPTGSCPSSACRRPVGAYDHRSRTPDRVAGSVTVNVKPNPRRRIWATPPTTPHCGQGAGTTATTIPRSSGLPFSAARVSRTPTRRTDSPLGEGWACGPRLLTIDSTRTRVRVLPLDTRK